MGSISGFGGLVCEYTEGLSFMCTPIIEVYNPLTKKKIRVLPNPPDHLEASPPDALINLVVDKVDTGFKIFFIYLGFEQMHPNDTEDSEHLPCTFTNPAPINGGAQPTHPCSLSLRVGIYGSSIMFQGLLYVLFSSCDLVHYWLFTYGIMEDVWEDTSVYFEPGSLGAVSPQLIMSDNRLFLVSWVADVSNKFHSFCRLHREEILLADMALSMVFQMTGELVKLVLHLPEMEESWRPWSRLAHGCPEIKAFGFAKSIMLMSKKSGISPVYDLVSCLWSQMPTNPMEPLPPGCELWYGKSMSLRLPRIPW